MTKNLILRISDDYYLRDFLNKMGIPYSDLIKSIDVDETLTITNVGYLKTRPSTTVNHKQHYHTAMRNWVSMPEFIQDKIIELATIKLNIHESCIEELSIILDQNITQKTKSLRYPFVPHRKPVHYEYV